MRINQNRNDILGAYQNKKLEKIEKFPTEKVSSKEIKTGKKGVIIDISDFARKIKKQNESILQNALAQELGSREIIEINQNIQNGKYQKPEVIEKIAEKLIEETEFFRN